jgi:hypothetical protein
VAGGGKASIVDWAVQSTLPPPAHLIGLRQVDGMARRSPGCKDHSCSRRTNPRLTSRAGRPPNHIVLIDCNDPVGEGIDHINSNTPVVTIYRSRETNYLAVQAKVQCLFDIFPV